MPSETAPAATAESTHPSNGNLLPNWPPAVLALADGSIFGGHSVGASGETVGEVVFNTAMMGYQEILTDPSYLRQIVTLTCAHIGNVGVNPEDAESDRIQAAGLIVKDVPDRVSNFRATANLAHYLAEAGTVAIAGVDTRRLTRLLRSTGAQNGCITTFAAGTAIGEAERRQAVERARTAESMTGLDLARVVSTRNRYEWNETDWQLGRGHGRQMAPQFHVVAYDFGVKRNILRMLASRGCRITVVPAETSAANVVALRPQGVFLSNGPGDPEPCDYAIRATRELVDAGLPIFGICLGHQLLALASGARTYKMKFSHHGANHPVKDLQTGRVSITSQNHGFAVDEKSLPPNLRPTHVSLFDGTLQGMVRTDRPAFCFQGHPEACPGPHDIGYLFDRFVALMAKEPAHA